MNDGIILKKEKDVGLEEVESTQLGDTNLGIWGERSGMYQ